MNWTLEVVTVPVSDVKRAKRFYSEQVGFIVDHDTRVSDAMHFAQLTPPGSGCSIVVGKGSWTCRRARSRACSWWSQTSTKRVPISSSEEWRSARSRLPAPPVFRPGREGDALDNVGFVFFSDPDGNGWAVQQISARG